MSAWLRGSSRRSFSLFALLGALYLIVALSVPGAFLIAKQASLLSSVQNSFAERWDSNTGEEDGEEDVWTGPKRLRGALLSKVGIDKKSFVSSLIVFPLPGAPHIRLIEHAQDRLVVAQEVPPPKKDKDSPQELLGRSPPSSLS